MGRRRILVALEVDAEPPSRCVCGEDSLARVSQDKCVENRPTWLHEFVRKGLEKLVLVDCVPLDVKASTAREFGEYGEDRPAIALEERVRMCQIAENFAWMRSQIRFVLTKEKGIFGRALHL